MIVQILQSTPHPQIERRQRPVKTVNVGAEEDPSTCPCLRSCTIFLGYTSNLISSGVRESIRYLVEHRMVRPSSDTLEISCCAIDKCYRICERQHLNQSDVQSSLSYYRRSHYSCPCIMYFFLCIGGCFSDHSWRYRGGSDQVFGPGLHGMLHSAWQGSVQKRPEQVGEHV